MKRLIIGGLAALALALGVAAPAQADDYFDICPSGLTGVATPDTSCVFADSLRASWYSQPGRTVFAYSPKTGLMYTMQCDAAWTTVWYRAKRCYGFNAFGAPLVVYVA